MTRDDPNVRRTLARLRLQRMELKRERKHVLQGEREYTPSVATDVLRTWARYDYVPPSLLKEIT